ncbi:unnamed protein product [Pleuronectes platessa]|uniref:Uncharacterized protein n=1 Tax=Pleuronectes platessa TaxID=8262 RepID=A0A9N7TV08_PLEPL|nr:unnamed protein product [Pleuronectes platessa]
MRVNIPKDNPNMTCQAVPRSTIQTRRHSSPQSPSTATHHEPPPRPWSNARTRCPHDTESATSTTISPHDTGSTTATPMRDTKTAIHGAATEALDLRVIKQRDGEEEGEAGKRSSVCHVS